MPVITDVILPILFVVLLGYLLRRFGRLDEHVLSRTQLYVLSPALIFMTMAGTEAAMALLLKVFLYVIILCTLLLTVTHLVGFAWKRDRVERNAMTLASTFTNSGFYGIPVCMLAFGDRGMAMAAVYMVCSGTFQATAGIYIASAGNRRAWDALLTVFKVPLVHAIVVARLLAHFDMLPPEPFMKMITLMGRSAIPLGLLLLGMQLERIISGDGRERAVGDEGLEARRDILSGITAGGIKIAGGFLFAILILAFFEFDPLMRNVIIVQSSMPTAVNAVVYATEFDCRPKIVTVGILTATLVSILSISLILGWLG